MDILFFSGLGEGRRVKAPFLDMVAAQKGVFLRAGTLWVRGQSVK